MEAVLIVDDPELAPVLSGTHSPTLEGWKAEDIGRSVKQLLNFLAVFEPEPLVT